MTSSEDRAAYLDRVRVSYDEVAEEYAALVSGAFPNDRLGRALLGVFADQVRTAVAATTAAATAMVAATAATTAATSATAAAVAPTVLDVGCGPGHVTAYLATLGLEARGLDLSKRMVELARREYPALRFDEGDMTELDVEPETFGGVLLWFTTHHLRPEWLPAVFGGCARALRPGGTLLLGTHVGAEEHTTPSRAYGGHPVSYESFLTPVDEIDALLGAAGLRVTSITAERPDPRVGGRAGARIFARKD